MIAVVEHVPWNLPEVVMTPAEKRKWRLMQLQQVQAENRKHGKKRKGKR